MGKSCAHLGRYYADKIEAACSLGLYDATKDEAQQKALYRWRLEWPSFEKGYEGRPETRRGVDVIHFQGGKIIRKLTYCKTTIEIDADRVRLVAEKVK